MGIGTPTESFGKSVDRGPVRKKIRPRQHQKLGGSSAITGLHPERRVGQQSHSGGEGRDSAENSAVSETKKKKHRKARKKIHEVT